MPGKVDALPLFPLGVVLLPHETLPLHIFEERYKTMIGECLERELEFGVLWMADDGLREVGCTAAITEVLERMDDGRMNILTEGRQPFRLRRRVDDLPYPAGDVELLEDQPGDPSPELTADVRGRYGELVERATDERPPELDDMGAYAIAGTIEFPPAVKQELLELRSEADRLESLAQLLQVALRRLELMEAAGESARSNGKVRISGD